MPDAIVKFDVKRNRKKVLFETDYFGEGSKVGGIGVSPNGVVYMYDSNLNVTYKICKSGMRNVAVIGNTGISNTSLRIACGICVDVSETIYIADYYNNKIKKMSLVCDNETFDESLLLSDVVGTDGFACKINKPTKVAVDKERNIYVIEEYDFRVRKIFPSGKTVVLAGGIRGMVDGNGVDSQFGLLSGIAVNAVGDVYVTDSDNNRIRKIDSSGNVSTVAYVGSSPSINELVIDKSGNFLFTFDRNNRLIMRVTTNGIVNKFTTYSPPINETIGIDKVGNLYYVESI